MVILQADALDTYTLCKFKNGRMFFHQVTVIVQSWLSEVWEEQEALAQNAHLNLKTINCRGEKLYHKPVVKILLIFKSGIKSIISMLLCFPLTFSKHYLAYTLSFAGFVFHSFPKTIFIAVYSFLRQGVFCLFIHSLDQVFPVFSFILLSFTFTLFFYIHYVSLTCFVSTMMAK